MNRTLNYLSIFIIVALSIGVYANTIKNGFVYDDKPTIVDNTLIKDINNLPKLVKRDYFALSGEMTYRPVVTLTYFLDYAVYGLKPWGYHITNGFFHAINGILLYVLLTILTQQSVSSRQSSLRTSLLANRPILLSLLFATHPLLTEAVNAISFREDLITTLFYIAALNLYLVLRTTPTTAQPQAARKLLLYSFSCGAYLLALFSKEMAVTLPLVVLCYEWIYTGEQRRFRFPLNPFISGYVVITLIYIYINFFYFGNHAGKGMLAQQEYLYGGTFRTSLFTMIKVFAYYIKLLLLPVNLCGDYFQYELSYNFDLGVITATLFIAALMATAFLGRRRCPLVSFGILFFFVTLLPVSNIIPIKNIMAERYLYLPSIGFFVLLAGVITSIGATLRYGAAWIFLLAISIILFSVMTSKRNLVWKDQFSFWSDVVKKMSGNSRAHYNLALSQPDLEIRIKELRTALYLNPTDDLARSKLATALSQKGDYDLAVELYMDILKRNPSDVKVLNSLARMYFAKGDYKNAKDIFEKLIVSDPNNPQLLNNLGSVYDMLKDHDKAIDLFNRALAGNPNNIETYYSLGIAYNRKGRYKEAEVIYKKALNIDKISERAHFGLGETYFNMGDYSGAAVEFKKAIDASPISPDAYYDLAYIYAFKGDYKASMDWLEKAINAGFKDTESLKKEKVFAPLRGNDRFKKLLLN